MLIDCISDLHGFFPTLEGGDLLIIAGDCTRNDNIADWEKFFDWIIKQNYKKIIVVAGNHDNFCMNWPTSKDSIYDIVDRDCVDYLCDSGEEFEGLKIWGSPWTKTFQGINPLFKAFTVKKEEELTQKWGLIPVDVDILITHSPPFGINDAVWNGQKAKYENVGSVSLINNYCHLKPKLHVFGHVHEGHGQTLENNTLFINASFINEYYEPVNKPIRIELLNDGSIAQR